MDGNSSRSHWSCARRPWKIPLDLLQPTSRTDTGDALPGCAQRQAARPRPATLVTASSPLLPGRPPAITTAAQLHPPAAGHSFFVPIGFVQGIAAASVRDRIISRRVRASAVSSGCTSTAGCSATVSCSFPARYRAVHCDARRGTRCREGESVVPFTEPPHSPPSDDARAAERSCRLFFSPR